MDLSIIILNYKTRGLLRQLLKGIKLYPPSVSYEVIVVDNGSADGSDEMVRAEFSNVKYLALPRNLGYARGTNVGLKQARGKFLLLLNTDIVVLEKSLDNFYAVAMAQPEAGIIGPRLNNPDGTIQETAYDFHKWFTPIFQRTRLGQTRIGQGELARFLLRELDRTKTVAVPWLMSSCIMVQREALDKTGIFDERFFVYMSDTDICRRMAQANYKVLYAPEVIFIHYHRRQSADDLRVALIHIFDFLKYQWKWRSASREN